MRKVMCLVVLAALVLASGCVDKKYEEGRDKQEQKAEKMMKDAEE